MWTAAAGQLWNYCTYLMNGLILIHMAYPSFCTLWLFNEHFFSAAPCPPTSIRTRLQYMSDNRQWIRIYWDRIDCDVEYLVEVTGRIQNDTEQQMDVMSYWVDRIYFEIPLPCSTYYHVTIRSRNSAGMSAESVPVTGYTGTPQLDSFLPPLCIHRESDVAVMWRLKL